MSRNISDGRKLAFYGGTILMVIGGISFLSFFVTGALNVGNFDNFDAHTRSSAIRAVGGMILLIVGGGLRHVGAAGLSGSGVILDPKKGREELEPYSRMAGGMIKDALDEADIRLGKEAPNAADPASARVIMIRCQACGKLNEDDSKFCQECGKPI